MCRLRIFSSGVAKDFMKDWLGRVSIATITVASITSAVLPWLNIIIYGCRLSGSKREYNQIEQVSI